MLWNKKRNDRREKNKEWYEKMISNKIMTNWQFRKKQWKNITNYQILEQQGKESLKNCNRYCQKLINFQSTILQQYNKQQRSECLRPGINNFNKNNKVYNKYKINEEVSNRKIAIEAYFNKSWKNELMILWV